MVDWKYLLLAQYPALFLLALLFLLRSLRARKSSAVKSVVWVLLFGASLAAAVLFAFLGVHNGYWALKTLFALGVASWIGVALVLAAALARLVGSIGKRRDRKKMERELLKAAKEKEDAVAQAHEAGKRAAREEAEAERLTRAANAADAEAAESDVAQAAAEPIELKLEE